MTDQYAVIGNPVAHSRSPFIHARFAEQTGEALEYGRLEANNDNFDATVQAFLADGGCGLNVTVPFKQEAWHLADVRTARADHAAAVNTLIRLADGRLEGDNTDGVGLLRDLTVNHDLVLRGKRILVLGAGGAVRGILLPLVEQLPLELVIANRTVSKAEGLLPLCHGVTRHALSFQDLAAERPFDLIINGTSAGLSGEMPTLPDGLLADGGAVQEMAYGAERSAFQRWAVEQGATTVIDGLGMLVEQAAESFFLWRGVRPQTAPVIAALRADLA
ncbi:shikimate dehydrogenase [Methylonatrum kenyense]|uniref:shikimate dehydrogenase n=1 Tax=Methylonatrum kenyense TaxID=455253 RepID=UPI0020C14A71|nr:shikimate dehydrogenase [Methylonatrum kenyense]MCK8516835.1 shikimate dehydrogenase [Methylonatrum kenyense]